MTVSSRLAVRALAEGRGCHTIGCHKGETTLQVHGAGINWIHELLNLINKNYVEVKLWQGGWEQNNLLASIDRAHMIGTSYLRRRNSSGKDNPIFAL